MPELRTYFAMSRPLQLVAVCIVAATGILIGLNDTAHISMPTVATGYIVLLLVSISIHYTNEYADVETDRLVRRTPFSGGSGALPASNLSRASVLLTAWLLLIAGGSIAILATVTKILSPTTLILLMAGAAGGWMYSLKPLKLAWHGWGEITNALLGGMLLMLYGYSLTDNIISASTVLLTLPFTAIVFVNLLATTWADRKADATVGKYTLATTLNIIQLKKLYAGGLLLSFIKVMLLYLLCEEKHLFFLWLLTVPFMWWAERRYTQVHNPAATVFLMIFLMAGQFLIWFLKSQAVLS